MTRDELIRREYEGRIERAVDFIYARHGDDIGLNDIADAAAFSRFHFHRVFSGVMGETVSDFLKRVRLQRAADRLASRPGESVTDAAVAVGFSSPSVFARAFRERYGVTATEWRRLGKAERLALVESKDGKAAGKVGQEDGNGWKAPDAAASYPYRIQYDDGRNGMGGLQYHVEVKDLPELTVAYARHVGPFDEIPEAFERLARWAGPRGLLAAPGARTLAIYHDSPETTPASRLRSSAALPVPPGTEVAGDINLMTVPGGRFAVARFEILPDQFGEAWDALMSQWFPSSGYQPDDRMCYEAYIATPGDRADGKFVIDICEPVKPL